MDWVADLFGGDTRQKVATSVAVFFLTTVLSLLIGRWWGRWRASREWSKKDFMNRVIVSVNCFADRFLKIRTIFERSLEEVFINSVAVGKVVDTAHRTTAANPILPLAKDDRWFILNFVLNAVAAEFNEAQMTYDANVTDWRSEASNASSNPLRPVTYLLFLTCEKVGPDRFRKVRAMMIRKDILPQMLEPSMPKFEKTWQVDRMTTLKFAAALYEKETERDNFLELEVYV